MNQEYFSIAGAWDILATSAKQHDEKAFLEAAVILDMRPVVILRGLAYIVHRLGLIPEQESSYDQMGLAMDAVSEVVSLMAAVIEQQNDSQTLEMFSEKRRSSGKQAKAKNEA
jgi:hypothetical protein